METQVAPNQQGGFRGLYRTFSGANVYITDYFYKGKQLGFLVQEDGAPVVQLFYDKLGNTRDYPTDEYNLLKGQRGEEAGFVKPDLAKIEEAKRHVMSTMQTV